GRRRRGGRFSSAVSGMQPPRCKPCAISGRLPSARRVPLAFQASRARPTVKLASLASRVRGRGSRYMYEPLSGWTSALLCVIWAVGELWLLALGLLVLQARRPVDPEAQRRRHRAAGYHQRAVLAQELALLRMRPEPLLGPRPRPRRRNPALAYRPRP